MTEYLLIGLGIVFACIAGQWREYFKMQLAEMLVVTLLTIIVWPLSLAAMIYEDYMDGKYIRVDSEEKDSE